MKVLPGIVLLSLLPALAFAGAANDRQVTVHAVGYIDAYPDTATLSASIASTAATVAQAKATVDKITSRAISGARAAGITRGDISAARIRVQPQYQWQDKQRVLVGQQVTRAIEVKLRNLNDYGRLVEALIGAGVTELGSVTFDFSNRDKLEQQALTSAAGAAKRKATTIAKAFGAHLGPVSQVSASPPPSRPSPLYRSPLMAAATPSSGSNFVFGRERIEAAVTAVFPLTGH